MDPSYIYYLNSGFDLELILDKDFGTWIYSVAFLIYQWDSDPSFILSFLNSGFDSAELILEKAFDCLSLIIYCSLTSVLQWDYGSTTHDLFCDFVFYKFYRNGLRQWI